MKRLLAIASLAACGGEGGKEIDATTIDGPPRDAAVDAMPDAPTAVRRVEPCPAAPAGTVTTTSSGQYAFVPADLMIEVGDIVKFAPEPLHNVIPHPTLPSDPGLRSGSTGETRCLQFVESGDFHYRCSPHPVMTGVVRVR